MLLKNTPPLLFRKHTTTCFYTSFTKKATPILVTILLSYFVDRLTISHVLTCLFYLGVTSVLTIHSILVRTKMLDRSPLLRGKLLDCSSAVKNILLFLLQHLKKFIIHRLFYSGKFYYSTSFKKKQILDIARATKRRPRRTFQSRTIPLEKTVRHNRPCLTLDTTSYRQNHAAAVVLAPPAASCSPRWEHNLVPLTPAVPRSARRRSCPVLPAAGHAPFPPPPVVPCSPLSSTSVCIGLSFFPSPSKSSATESPYVCLLRARTAADHCRGAPATSHFHDWSSV
jgi:hypothetical protein